MPKATLIWFSGPDKPFRSIDFPKRLLYAVAGTFVFFGLATLVLSIMLGHYVMELGEQREKTATLSATVESQGAALEQVNAENESLGKDLEQIRVLESRVRELLGMEGNPARSELSNQGGAGPQLGAPDDEVEMEPVPKTQLEEVLNGLDKPSNLDGPLKDRMSEVVNYLEERSAQMQGIPTILPVRGDNLWISCDFGWRTNPFTGQSKEYHNGLDIAGPWKSPIIAPADGVVVKSGKHKYLGNYVKLRHPSGILTSFGHLASCAVKKGAKVKRGDVIGYMGNTGRTTGTHLHYAVIKDKRFVDPLKYIWDGLSTPLASLE